MKKVKAPITPPKVARKKTKKSVQSSQYSAVNIECCQHIMRAQLSGNIILPHGLGLNKANYQTLRKALNDSDLIHKEIEWYKDDWRFIRERAALCSELFSMKEDERQSLITLLNQHRNQQDPFSEQIAVIIATASLTSFHLWESLGLPDRAQLGELIQYNFPKLYALNSKNMRWKRFFYRMLCEQGGDYLCRAPSCDECKSYTECFA
ncbi:MAG: nitrogen fixation protein NifQ [Psychromonas sp.]